jgi:hypothetical protein
VTITIDPTLARATPAARTAIMDAFGAWMSTGAHLPQVSFDVTNTPGGAAQDGVNRLLFGPITIPGQERDLAVTISYSDANSGDVVEADTIFNSAFDWTSVGASSSAGKCKRDYDLQNVATHEAGHLFGLGEDYADTTTTMYVSSLPCQTSKRALSVGDVSVVEGLYAQPLQSPTQGGACGARVAVGSDNGAVAPLSVAIAAMVIRRRRRDRSRRG